MEENGPDAITWKFQFRFIKENRGMDFSYDSQLLCKDRKFIGFYYVRLKILGDST
jgi:hypothetical protein